MEELDKVKQLYLRVCEEKNGIEDQLKEKIRGDFNKKLLEVRRIQTKKYVETFYHKLMFSLFNVSPCKQLDFINQVSDSESIISSA